MNLKKLWAVYLTLLLSTSVWGHDHLMFIGAGGEDAKKDSTMFDTAIENMGKYVNQSKGLKVNVALNGGHAKTEAILSKSFAGAESKTNFQAADYRRLIKSYKAKLQNNEMGPGDQLMIYIESHGAQNQKNMKTHSIATTGGSVTNFDTLSGSSTVNLDELAVLTKLAKEKGVKLAIIDTSCHSGNTLALADDNTCVISSTGPNHYGYAPFSRYFTSAMAKGKNLEDIYLEARNQDATAALPMISTESGQAATQLLYDKITPFLFHFSSNNDKLTPYLEKNLGNELQCVANFDSLMASINQIEALNTTTKKILFWKTKHKRVNLKRLKKLLTDYEKSLRNIQQELRSQGGEVLNQKETFNTPSHKISYSWKEIVTTDFAKLMTEQQARMALDSNPHNAKLFEDLISVYAQANTKKNEILKNNPGLKDVGTREKKIKNSIDSNYFTAAAIGAEERKLYSAFYQKDNKPNPCKDFKL